MRLTACLFMLCSVCFHLVSFVLDCLCSFVPNSQLTMDVQSGLCSAKPLTDLRTVSLQVEAFSAREDDLGEFVSNHVFPLTHKHSYSKTFFTSCWLKFPHNSWHTFPLTAVVLWSEDLAFTSTLTLSSAQVAMPVQLRNLARSPKLNAGVEQKGCMCPSVCCWCPLWRLSDLCLMQTLHVLLRAIQQKRVRNLTVKGPFTKNGHVALLQSIGLTRSICLEMETRPSLCLCDFLYPTSTKWPEPAEPRGCHLKPWEESLKEWGIICSSTEAQRYKLDIRKCLIYSSPHLKAKAFTLTKPFWVLWDVEKKNTVQRVKSDVCWQRLEQDEWMMLTQRIWTCRSGCW